MKGCFQTALVLFLSWTFLRLPANGDRNPAQWKHMLVKITCQHRFSAGQLHSKLMMEWEFTRWTASKLLEAEVAVVIVCLHILFCFQGFIACPNEKRLYLKSQDFGKRHNTWIMLNTNTIVNGEIRRPMLANHFESVDIFLQLLTSSSGDNRSLNRQ